MPNMIINIQYPTSAVRPLRRASIRKFHATSQREKLNLSPIHEEEDARLLLEFSRDSILESRGVRDLALLSANLPSKQ